MSDNTVLVAIITAGSGILGAILGASGAVLGPWWVKKTELQAQRAASEIEERRKAIVDFADKKSAALTEYHQVFCFGSKSDGLIDLTNAANKSSTELYSRIKKDDALVKDWINKMCFRAFASKPKTFEELTQINAFFHAGIQHLLSWHVGELSTKGLKPFGLDKENNPVWLKDWETAWPK